MKFGLVDVLLIAAGAALSESGNQVANAERERRDFMSVTRTIQIAAVLALALAGCGQTQKPVVPKPEQYMITEHVVVPAHDTELHPAVQT
jgi:hypothetical protein